MTSSVNTSAHSHCTMAPKMQYGESPALSVSRCRMLTRSRYTVRLGNSGLKVSKIILGCMSYGTPEWQSWVLPEEEAIKHIKFAYVSRLFRCRSVAKS